MTTCLHFQCQNIQIATSIIIITIHSNLNIYIQTVCIPETCGWRGIQLHLKNASKSAAFWCYCKTFPIRSFLVLLQNLPNTQLSGVIAKPSQYTAFWCYCKTFPIHSFLVLFSLPTLQHTTILRFGGLVQRWNLSTLGIWRHARKKILKLTWLRTLITPNPIRLWIFINFMPFKNLGVWCRLRGLA